jgi:hypothetical protein
VRIGTTLFRDKVDDLFVTGGHKNGADESVIDKVKDKIRDIVE